MPVQSPKSTGKLSNHVKSRLLSNMGGVDVSVIIVFSSSAPARISASEFRAVRHLLAVELNVRYPFSSRILSRHPSLTRWVPGMSRRRLAGHLQAARNTVAHTYT